MSKSGDSKRKPSSNEYEVGGKSFTRPIKKDSNSIKPSYQTAEPIDETQQEKIVSHLKLEASRQADNGRNTFYYLFLILAGFYAVCLIYSVEFPMEMEHQVLHNRNHDISY
jgi:hypothetical protein